MAAVYIDHATAGFIGECRSCWLSTLRPDGTCQLETRMTSAALDPNTVVMADGPGRHRPTALRRQPGWASYVDLSRRQGLRLRGLADTWELGQTGFLHVVAPLEADHPGLPLIMSVTVFTVLEVHRIRWSGPDLRAIR